MHAGKLFVHVCLYVTYLFNLTKQCFLKIYPTTPPHNKENLHVSLTRILLFFCHHLCLPFFSYDLLISDSFYFSIWFMQLRIQLLFHLNSIFLFACIKSQLRHAGSIMQRMNYLDAAHRLSSCSAWAQLLCGLCTHARVGAQFLDQGSNHVPCIAGLILNHWTTRKPPYQYYHFIS